MSIIVITIHSFIYIFNNDKIIKQNNIHDQIYGYTIISIIISIFYFCICYIQTLYIILQPEAQGFDNNNSPYHKYSLTSNSTPQYDSNNSTYNTPSSFPASTPEIASRMSAHSKSSPSFHTNQISNSNNNTNQQTKSPKSTSYTQSIRLNNIFKNDNTFKLFIRHLAKEYCIENALFLFESQQFKKQLNTIETQLLMMNSQRNDSITENNQRISNSKSRTGIYSKQRKNLLLSVPTTVPEQDNNNNNSEIETPTSPISDDGNNNENKFDEILTNISTKNETKSVATLKLMSHHLKQHSNHYEGRNKILDFLPFHLIPQSQIIEKYQNDFEKIFIKLYDKYIDWKTSSFEINISGTHRSVLHSIYIRITYQLLMEERKQLLMEQNESKRKSNFLNIQNGFVVDKNDKN
eukprot:109145_1